MVYFNLEKLLKEKGKSRYWLVKKMDSNYSAINNLVDNTAFSVRLETIDKLLKIFDCEPNDLFTIGDREDDRAQS